MVIEGQISANDNRLKEIVGFVIKHYQWEGSSKAKLEALMDICLRAGNIDIGDHLYANYSFNFSNDR